MTINLIKESNQIAVIKVTSNCPGRCKCCANRKKLFPNKTTNNGIMDISFFEKICIQLKDMGNKYISISGGEPTTLVNLDQYIKIAKQNNLVVRVNTNGWNVTEDSFENWMKSGLDQIALSIYGLTPEGVNKTRGKIDIFERSMNALNVISNYRKSNKFLFIMQTVIMKDNYTILPDLLQKAFESKCDLFWPSYLEDSYNLPELRLSEKDISYFKNEILNKLKIVVEDNVEEESIKNELFVQVEKYFNNRNYSSGVYHDENSSKCTLPGRFLLIYPNGLIAPCPGHEYFSSEKELLMGENTLKNIVFSKEFKSFDQDRNMYCSYCPQGVHIGFKLNPSITNEYLSARDL